MIACTIWYPLPWASSPRVDEAEETERADGARTQIAARSEERDDPGAHGQRPDRRAGDQQHRGDHQHERDRRAQVRLGEQQQAEHADDDAQRSAGSFSVCGGRRRRAR